MTETSKFLAILAKVMQTDTPNVDTNKKNYNKLYITIHSELNAHLQGSVYPYAADIIQKK